MIRQQALALVASVFAMAAHGRGVSPYLPLGLSPEIERQVERVMLLADRPVLSRPIAAAAVLEALPVMCERDPAVCADVRRYLSGYMRTAGLSHASIALAADSGARTVLPNRHGMRADSPYEISASGYWQPGDRFLISGGFHAYEDETVPAGSLLSAGSEYAQLDLGYREHWFSPLTTGSMLIGSQAETIPSVTLSNYSPLTRWKFRYELFVGELSSSDRIRFADGFTSGNPRLAGMHVAIEPLPGWSIAVNRVMQFGGGARGGDSLRDIFDAFFNPSGEDNRGGDLSLDNEFGNQAASITSSIIIPGERPFEVYFEYAGEDTSTLSNLRLGNVGFAAGVHFPMLFDRVDLTAEFGEWQNSWYVHSIYLDGLTNHGSVIGHWGGDWRAAGDGVGAQSLLARVGWRPSVGGWIEATYRTLANESYTAPQYERAHLLDVVYSRRWREFNVGAEINVGADVFGESYSRVSGFIRF